MLAGLKLLASANQSLILLSTTTRYCNSANNLRVNVMRSMLTYAQAHACTTGHGLSSRGVGRVMIYVYVTSSEEP